MHPPCEVMVRTFLPGMRGLVAHELRGRGRSQGNISQVLGVTQASISQYLAKDRVWYRGKVASLGIDDLELERYVDLLCEDLSRGRVEGVYTFYSIWKNLLATGTLCEAHHKISPLTPECDACMRIFGTIRLDTPRDMVLRDLEKAVTVIETSRHFTFVMPEVSVNVVRAIEGAKDEGDVAGIPGRIVEIRGKARAMMQPEFGVSRHMAKILLTFLRYDRKVNACINIKYDAEIAEMLSDVGSRVVKTVGKQESSTLGGDVVVAALEKTLEGLDEGVRVVVDDGGPGLEPMIYMFGEDAEQLAKKCVKVARNSLHMGKK